ncbi:MAG: hypothetical protein QM805_07835 [Pseudomonas sp.]
MSQTQNRVVDFTDAIVGDNTIRITEGEPMIFTIEVAYDKNRDLVRVRATDIKSGNEADRPTSNGMVSAGFSARIPVRTIYDLLPEMIEEIVILNRLMGHALPAPKAGDDE